MNHMTRRKALRVIGGGGLAALAAAGYALGVEPMRERVTRYRLAPPRWRDGPNLRVAVIADLHACEPYVSAARIRGMVERANALQPDVILLLGDYVSGMAFVRPVPPKDWADALAGLAAPLGVHAVLGNHDWWEDEAAQARGDGPTIAGEALRGVGIPVYENTAVRLEKDGRPFWLVGLADQIALRQGGRWVGRHDLPGALAQAGDDALMILMAHEPDIFPEVPARAALTVSGHTHGGQVRLFGWSPVVPPRFGGRYAYGHATEPDAQGEMRDLIVSGGLGCSIAPVRFGVPPEIVVIELSGA